eukprot:TRINITY_DN5568_c0_g2_i1.p1 TRINITY_DN5568_c0_g2~~TRINITY_DN5568_c0_g2_i1.p1  ORF type:complete len:426 (-),score=82.13 TRINITY_DN5568_c0_g2_i1:72-1349(-)
MERRLSISINHAPSISKLPFYSKSTPPSPSSGSSSNLLSPNSPSSANGTQNSSVVPVIDVKQTYTLLVEENGGAKKKFSIPLGDVEELTDYLRKTFVIEGVFELLHFDEEFKEYVKLERLDQLVNFGGKIKWKSVTPDESLEALEAICKKMQDPETGIPVKTKKWRLKQQYRVFSGSSAVKWMQKECKLSHPKSVALGQKLMDHRFIFHINHSRKKFYDDKVLYRFQELGEGSFTPQASIKHDELAAKMLDPRQGLKVKDRKIFLKKYKNTFSGSDAVDWLSAKLGVRRNIAIIIGEKLMTEGYFHPCGTDTFADEEEFYYTIENTKKNQNLDFPVERVVHVLQKLKSEDAFRDIAEDVDFVINVLASGAKSLYVPNVPEFSEDPQFDRDVKSFILYHIGQSDPENEKKKRRKWGGRKSSPHFTY